jgi:FkbM family methyltransferase
VNLHLVGIFHTQHTAAFSHCAFTGKALRFPRMMQRQGYRVIEYSNSGSESGADEHVEMLSLAEYQLLYGKRADTDFHGNDATLGTKGHQLFESRLIPALRERLQPQDIICHPFGHAHQQLMTEFPNHQHVETGIGYPTLMPNSFRIFESYAWMHYHQGKEGRNGKNYEWVVPNYYDLDDWDVRTEHGSYLAFLGRITELKGIDTIRAIAEHSPWPIVLHGQGDPSRWQHPNIEYRGPLSGRKRSEFLGNARALLAPTVFTEPFCGMAVEAMLCGTPVVSVNYGAMTETIQPGMGFRCHTLQDWLDGINDVGTLNRQAIADRARSIYSFDACGKQYDKIFKQINDLYRAGWYELRQPDSYEKNLIALSSGPQNIVVVGAMDGATHDRLFPHASRNKHWSGLLIEPVNSYFEKLKSNYANRENLIFENLAITDSLGEREITVVDRGAITDGVVPAWCDGVSTFLPDNSVVSRDGIREHTKTERVTCTTFAELAKKHSINRIDILQIDAEGCDADIFKQIWRLGYRPKLICIEVVHINAEELSEIRSTLVSSGYLFSRESDDLVAIKTEVPAPTKRTRVAFFTHTQWALGSIHSALCKELYEYGIDADLIDWDKNYTLEDWIVFDRTYDIFVTLPGSGVSVLISAGVDYAKIVAIAHGRYDLDVGVALNNDFLALKNFAGIATSLVDDAKRLGISRAMSVTRNGIHTDRFDMPISERLSVLGYAGADAAYTHAGVEWKRGRLVEEIAARVGLPLVKAGFRPFISMPNFYQNTDCVIVTSDENEACGLPIMEAAASGRLPLSARIGITCEFERPPGIIVPTEPDNFVQVSVEHLSELIASPARYRLMCETAQEFAKKNYDWSVVASDWAKVILGDCPGT